MRSLILTFLLTAFVSILHAQNPKPQPYNAKFLGYVQIEDSLRVNDSVYFRSLKDKSTHAPGGYYAVYVDSTTGRLYSQSVAAGGSVWDLSGNALTDSITQFAGTTNAYPYIVKYSNLEKIRIDGRGVKINSTFPVQSGTGNTFLSNGYIFGALKNGSSNNTLVSYGGILATPTGNAKIYDNFAATYGSFGTKGGIDTITTSFAINGGQIYPSTAHQIERAFSANGGLAQMSFSTAIGQGIKTVNAYEFSCGRYNDTTLSNQIFSVGVGSNEPTRKNAIAINRTGNMYFNSISNSKAAKAMYYNSTTGEVTYGDTLSASSSAWGLSGNALNDSTNQYIRTTNAYPLIFGTNGVQRFKIHKQSSIFDFISPSGKLQIYPYPGAATYTTMYFGSGDGTAANYNITSDGNTLTFRAAAGYSLNYRVGTSLAFQVDGTGFGFGNYDMFWNGDNNRIFQINRYTGAAGIANTTYNFSGSPSGSKNNGGAAQLRGLGKVRFNSPITTGMGVNGGVGIGAIMPGSTGTTDNTNYTRFLVCPTRNLTDNSNDTLFSVPIGADGMFQASCAYTMSGTDGTNKWGESGQYYINAIVTSGVLNHTTYTKAGDWGGSAGVTCTFTPLMVLNGSTLYIIAKYDVSFTPSTNGLQHNLTILNTNGKHGEMVPW